MKTWIYKLTTQAKSQVWLSVRLEHQVGDFRQLDSWGSMAICLDVSVICRISIKKIDGTVKWRSNWQRHLNPIIELHKHACRHVHLHTHTPTHTHPSSPHTHKCMHAPLLLTWCVVVFVFTTIETLIKTSSKSFFHHPPKNQQNVYNTIFPSCANCHEVFFQPINIVTSYISDDDSEFSPSLKPSVKTYKYLEPFVPRAIDISLSRHLTSSVSSSHPPAAPSSLCSPSSSLFYVLHDKII